MKFRDLPLCDVESWFVRVLGPAANISERSRRVVASIQIDAGREPVGLDPKAEKQVRLALQGAA